MSLSSVFNICDLNFSKSVICYEQNMDGSVVNGALVIDIMRGYVCHFMDWIGSVVLIVYNAFVSSLYAFNV